MNKKGIIITVVVGVLALGIIGFFLINNSKSTPLLSVVTTPLTKGNLQNTVSATGTVESSDRVKVSNTSTEPIEKIYVSLGDWVGYGDWLYQTYNKQTDTYTDVKNETPGTITNIKAVKGALANGELFTIENVSDLRIRGKVKESELNRLYKNMPVIVKSDATGQESFEGNLFEIAPTAIRSEAATGGTPSKNAEFEVLISLPLDTPLKIGMTTRLTIITEDKNDIFTVPMDALVFDANQAPSILAAQEKSDTPGTYEVISIPVTLGMENESQIEISGDQLTDGLNILTQNPEIAPGTLVKLNTNPSPETAPTSGGVVMIGGSYKDSVM